MLATPAAPSNCRYPIFSKPFLIFDAIMLVYLIPFLITVLYYANNSPLWCMLGGNTNIMELNLYYWGITEGSLMAASAVDCIIHIILWCCLSTYCVYISWLICRIFYVLWRLSWLVVGSVLFWKLLYPAQVCTSGINGFMFTHLIVGFVHVIITIVFLICARPQPLAPPVGALTPLPTATTNPMILSPKYQLHPVNMTTNAILNMTRPY